MKKFLFLIVLILVSRAMSFAQQDSILRILAIGNSFSEDGIENYLHELADAADKQIIIGNLYIGGAPLALHVENATKQAAAYSYRKIELDGHKKTTEQVSIADALADERWDYISFQQASPLSGNYTSIETSLPTLVNYVRTIVGPTPAFVYHQTWAYQANADHEGFKNYNNDQLTMYRAITAASKKVNKLGYFKAIIPAGTAVQNGRSSRIGDHYTRDGYHLQLDYGRFTAACTWFEKLFHLDVRQIAYKPASVTSEQAEIAKRAAHAAVKKPYKVTKIKL